MTPARKRVVLRVAVIVLLVATAAVLTFSPLRAWFTIEHLRQVVDQMRGSWYAPVFFILLYAVGCVVFLPASIFILAAGVIWGWLFGGIYAVTGGVLGAMASFFVSRFLGGDLLSRFGTRGENVARRLEAAGFKTMLVLRLIPIFPFAVLNYGAGMAGIRTRDYFWATLIGTAPSHFVVAYSADALLSGELTKADAMQRLLTVGVLVALVILLPLLLKRRAERALVREE